MIQNHDELLLVRQQLERAEAALNALRRDVLPVSEARFNLMAESYLDQIDLLRRDIREYENSHHGLNPAHPEVA